MEGALFCPACSVNPEETRAPASPDETRAPAASGNGASEPVGTVVPPAEPEGTRAPVAAPEAGAAVVAGAALGPRYEVVRLLGKGGMGAVYLARDRELGRDVAVKLIAPHLSSQPTVLDRFRREIQLSSQVTHPNVLRVFDLAEHDGLRFLTMQFIDGRSLADVVASERPLPEARALALFIQVCKGVEAAHENGVLHRDLKPQNVMIDAGDHAFVTDFGLATSSDLSAMTQTGALMGTPHYMSPEQVMGKRVDARSDIFSLGVILYELLAGKPPFEGDSPFEVMMVRTRAPPRPLRDLNPAVAPRLQAVLDRCLAIEPEQRFASVAELLDALGGGALSRAPLRRRTVRRLVGVGTAAMVLAAGAAAAWRWWPRAPTGPAAAVAATARPPEMVLVGDIRNETGDPLFDGTLEPALGLALENASFLTAFSRTEAERIAAKQGLPGSGLDDRRARLVAQREGIRVLTSGVLTRSREGYRLSLRTTDPFSGEVLLDAVEDVPSKEEVLAAAARLAARVRTKLGDATPEAVQLKQGESISATSIEAAHAFSQGVELSKQGKFEDAKKQLLEATRLDPGLGRAYVGIGVVENNLGHRAEAERYMKEAMARVDRMSEREKFRSRGLYYMFYRDTDKAIEAFSALVKQFPADTAALANLGFSYQLKRDFVRALGESRRALEIYPRDILTRNNVGLFATFTGDSTAAIDEQVKVVEQNPEFANGWIGLALAQLAAGKVDEARATWEKLRAVDAGGASAASEGLADLALFLGRLSEARALLEAGVRADVAAGAKDLAARKLVMLGEVHLARGQLRQAAAAAERALPWSGAEYVTYAAAEVLARAGEAKRARAIADELDRNVAAEPRMYAELLRGTVELRAGRPAEAVARYRAALERADAWPVHRALAEGYLAARAYTEAHDELETCVRRRGEAVDVHLDFVPTFRLYAPVLYELGVAAEGLGSPAAAGAYREFIALRPSPDDPLAVGARRRLAALEAMPGRRDSPP
jgi:tetratricopeptide (TPR) repeat protein